MKYETLDAQILKAIGDGFSKAAQLQAACAPQIDPLVAAEEIESFRILDRRLQALRKQGKISYSAGWKLGKR